MEKILIRGFAKIDYDKREEILFAVFPNGLILESPPIATPNFHFNRPGRIWKKSAVALYAVNDFTFLGNYEAPPYEQ